MYYYSYFIWSCLILDSVKLTKQDGECRINNGTLVRSGTVTASSQWYFTCLNSNWAMTGCAVNGELVPENSPFQLTTEKSQGNPTLWGICRQLGNDPRPPRMLYQDVKGCLDVYGNPVSPGNQFLFTEYVWAICRIKTVDVVIAGFGTVPINVSSFGEAPTLFGIVFYSYLEMEVYWTLEGCNNGTSTIVAEGQDFVWLQDVFKILGARLRCDLKPPGITPRACIAGIYNNDRWSVRKFPDKCYVVVNKSIGFCTFTTNNDGSMSWNLNFVPQSPQAVKALRDQFYTECSFPDEELTNLANGNRAVLLASNPVSSKDTKKSKQKNNTTKRPPIIDDR